MLERRFVLVLVSGWMVVYGARAVVGHLSLATNAYDLSVFDYALWSTSHGRVAFVPFMHESLFAQHVMPTLLLLWPAHVAWPSPWLLILVQLMAFASAAILLDRLLPPTLPWLTRYAILIAFLLGRRSHSAVTSYFYIESLEPLLVFGAILLWRSERRWWALAAAVLAIGCKEDMAIYFAMAGVLLFVQHWRRSGAAIAAVSVAWLIVSVWVVVPAVRRAEGLPGQNPFAASIEDSPSAALAQLPARVASRPLVKTILTLSLSVGLFCWFAPGVFAVALPGLVLTSVANPHTTSIGITGHYLFPVLPWLFYAATRGAGRIHAWSPRLLQGLSALLVVGTLADSPSWQGWHRVIQAADTAREVRGQLGLIPADASLLAMPNLVPHVPHRMAVSTLGRNDSPSIPAEYVAISQTGDLWPFAEDQVSELVQRYKADTAFTQVADGPLYLFRRR